MRIHGPSLCYWELEVLLIEAFLSGHKTLNSSAIDQSVYILSLTMLNYVNTQDHVPKTIPACMHFLYHFLLSSCLGERGRGEQ